MLALHILSCLNIIVATIPSDTEIINHSELGVSFDKYSHDEGMIRSNYKGTWLEKFQIEWN